VPSELSNGEKSFVRALTVRQPYAELIMHKEKNIEYRSKPTIMRERVYVYVAKRPGKVEDFERAGAWPGELPTGMLVGTVEITDCSGRPRSLRVPPGEPRAVGRAAKAGKAAAASVILPRMGRNEAFFE
jgi:hypothetical protein